MRVISGEKKGLTLTGFKGDSIRPTSDKVRGALFSSLESLVGPIDVFVDCFAGSGAISIEALSRGAGKVYLFDNSRKSLEVIRRNLDKAGYLREASLLPVPALKGLEALRDEGVKADVFFMDPPYKKLEQVYGLLEKIDEWDLLAKGGVIMIEHDKSDIMLRVASGFEIYKERKYGNTVVTVYCRRP